MRVRPVGRQVLVKPFKDEIQYGKLHLPDSAKVRANNGIVYATGDRTTDVSRGDWVLFSRRQATDLEVEGSAFVLVDERACFALLAEKEAVIIKVYCYPEWPMQYDPQISRCESIEECDIFLYTVRSPLVQVGYALGLRKQVLAMPSAELDYFPEESQRLVHKLADPAKRNEAIKLLGGAL